MNWRHIQGDDHEHWVAGDESLELLVQTIPGIGDALPAYFWLVLSRPDHIYSMGETFESPETAMACAESAARDWRER